MTDFIQVVDECLDILEIPKEDNSITEWKVVTFTPQTQSNNNSPNAINIDINATDSFILPSKSYLLIEGQLRRNTNNIADVYDNDHEVALINNAMMYLFTEIKYSMGGKVLETIINPGQTTSIFGYLRFPDDYNSNAGMHQCWAKDTSTHPNSSEFTASVAAPAAGYIPAKNANYNQGFAVRKGYLMASTTRGNFEFKIPLDHIFGFAEYNKVFWGIKHSLTLTRSGNNTQAIYRANAAPAGKVDIKNITWQMPHIQIDPELLTKFRENVLAKKVINVSYNARNCESTEVTEGARSWTWRLAVPGGVEKPRWIIVGFQTDKCQTQEQNPALFNNMNLENVQVLLNGVRYPDMDIDINFDENKYATLYDMFDNFKKSYDGFSSLIGGTQVSYAAFKTLFPIFVVDVRRQSEKIKSGVIDVQLKFNFRAPVAANTTAYSVIISDRHFRLKTDGTNLTIVSK